MKIKFLLVTWLNIAQIGTKDKSSSESLAYVYFSKNDSDEKD